MFRKLSVIQGHFVSGPVDGSISVLRKKKCAPSAAPREVWRHAPPRKFCFLRSFLLHSGVKTAMNTELIMYPYIINKS